MNTANLYTDQLDVLHISTEISVPVSVNSDPRKTGRFCAGLINIYDYNSFNYND
jgi:hypothetical protein